MPSLLELPSTTHRQIASYLAVGDAISLASSCTSLQDAGESRIWARLDLTFDVPERPNATRLLQKAKEHAIINDELPPGKIDLLQGALEYIDTLLRTRPCRKLYIRDIRVACHRYHWDGREHLAAGLAGAEGVVDGDWEAVENSRVNRWLVGQWLANRQERLTAGPISHPSLASTFASLPILPAVRLLHLDLWESWEEYAEVWRKLTPNVTSLTVGLRAYPFIESLAFSGRHWVPWTGLTSLRFLDFSRCLARFATSQISANPGLRSLEMGSWKWRGQSEGDMSEQAALVAAIKGLEGLAELTVPDELKALLEAEDCLDYVVDVNC